MFIWLRLPETKGKTLEQIEHELAQRIDQAPTAAAADRTSYERRRTDFSRRTITLANDAMQVAVAPDLGGKILSLQIEGHGSRMALEESVSAAADTAARSD